MNSDMTDLCSLFSQHNDAIKKLYDRIKHLDNNLYYAHLDQLFVLRFILSANGDTDLAFHNMSDALEFRKKYRADLVRAHQEQQCEGSDILLKYSKVGFQGSIDEQPVFIVRVGHCNIRKIASTMSTRDIVFCMLMLEEYAFQLCDALSRENHRLIKLQTVFDMSSVSVLGFSIPFFKALGIVSHKSHVIYPQLMGRKIFIKAPRIMRTCMHLYNKFQHKKSIEKQLFCGCKNIINMNACPFASRHAKYMPQFLGGDTPILDSRLEINKNLR